MARGKYLSLEEARKQKNGLKRFAKEHPTTGNAEAFDQLLDAMAHGGPPRKKPKGGETSSQASRAGSSDTQTRRGT